jgi:predicted PurR-regulated permease PerM
MPRFRHARRTASGGTPPPAAVDPRDLTELFAPPRWLSDLGTSAWLAAGVAVAVAGGIALLTLTQTIVGPLIAATVVAAVVAPLIAGLHRRGIPRAAAAGLLLLAAVVLAAAVIAAILAGVDSQHDEIAAQLSAAKDHLTQWLDDLGVGRPSAQEAVDDGSVAVSAAVPALLKGVAIGLKALSSLAVFLSLTALSLFFLLKDGPAIRRWLERHMGIPPAIAHDMGDRALESLQGYFKGVTVVAIFNAAVVFVGALILGVPLPGTIALVTFLGAYVPYLGAWSAGAFSFLVALGGAGVGAAVAIAVVQLLANGALQQLVQPIAMGAALGIHPLAVLVVTIAGGALFGATGLILAAPVTSAVSRIAADLSAHTARAEAQPVAEPAEEKVMA